MVDIKKLEVEDIVKILNDDKFESHVMFNNCKGQWTQFLINNVNNDNVLIIGRVEENELKNFAVVIRKHITHLLYISDDVLDDQEYKDMIFEWGNKENPQLKNLETCEAYDGIF